MQTQLPVIRTYTGPDREATQEAYRRDARQARATGWVPVAHRWRIDGDAHELAVVFELHAVPAAQADDATEHAGVGRPGRDPADADSRAPRRRRRRRSRPTPPRPAAIDEARRALAATRAPGHVTAAVAPVSVARARARAASRPSTCTRAASPSA